MTLFPFIITNFPNQPNIPSVRGPTLTLRGPC